jgi:hypothetical protein
MERQAITGTYVLHEHTFSCQGRPICRRAPEGSYFSDGDRASGVFGVLATGFSVLLGFIIFLAFSSYDQSRSGAEDEALVVAQQVETAQFLPDGVGNELTGELVCYGRSVVNGEWDRMETGTQSDAINPWASSSSARWRAWSRAARASSPRTRNGSTRRRPARRRARPDPRRGGRDPDAALDRALLHLRRHLRLHALFADRGERAVTQAFLMGAVTAVLTLMLLLLGFFDSPFQSGVGGLRPVAMERTLRIVDEALGAVGGDIRIPCNSEGIGSE